MHLNSEVEFRLNGVQYSKSLPDKKRKFCLVAVGISVGVGWFQFLLSKEFNFSNWWPEGIELQWLKACSDLYDILSTVCEFSNYQFVILKEQILHFIL